MIKPTMDMARQLSEKNTVVPISLELFSDIRTPIEVLKCLKAKSKHCYLLESVEGGEKWGRYSFLGFDPKLTVKCNNKKVTITSETVKEVITDNPNKILREILGDYKSPKLDFLPSFTGGFVGYMAYDYIQYFEKKLAKDSSRPSEFDDFNLMLFDKIVAFDHLRQKIIIIVNIQTDNIETNYANGVLKLKEIEGIIKSSPVSVAYQSKLVSDFKPLFNKDQYCGMVEKVKEYIYEGDIFQAVIANRVEAEFYGDLLSTYRVLRTINPSPYMFYMDFNGLQIAGASPETLVSLKNKKLTNFAIAGTCPRGKSEQEDETLIEALLKNEKELSEHNMLVDLGRNDLGKISEFGTVEVEEYKNVLKFSHVSHISSTISGTIKDGLDQFDALKAVLPAGTLSGAPKIRAMEIINELEKEKRGVYGGAIGYIDFSGNMDMCIAIRMVVKQGDKVYISSGAGIVADSNPIQEYEECVNKSKAIMEALERSQEVD